MTLQELTSQLQTLCHEGHAQKEIMIENPFCRYYLKNVKFYMDKADNGSQFVAIVENSAE